MKSVVLGLLLMGAATPCLWDSDTLDTELRGLPDAFDLVVGRFHQHGPAYYQERVARLGGKPELTMAELDDLAVAHEHLGDHEQAIVVMQQKAAALVKAPDPEHRYRYLANLGTFHAHAGRYDEALTALRAAVAMNPNAHFGRERFQIEAIEYIAAAKQQPELWRRQSFLRHAGYQAPLFIWSSWLAAMPYETDQPEFEADWRGQRELDWDSAYKAIGGMLRFGGREGAELYRALGELFLQKQHLNLAWWSFRRAIERGHPAAELLRTALGHIEEHWREAYKLGGAAIRIPDEALYASFRGSADQWLQSFQSFEAAAIANGEDVTSDTSVQALLERVNQGVPCPSLSAPMSTRQLLLGAGACVIAVGLVLLLLRLRASR